MSSLDESANTLVIQRRSRSAQYFEEPLSNDLNLEMVLIPGGSFMMGSPETEEGHRDSESPQHLVTVPTFFMGKYPVTQAQWQQVAGLPQVNRELEPKPSRFKGADLPVEQVSWHDAVEFCERISRQTNRNYRLPSEAEWEYACRAETTTPYHFGGTIDPAIANYKTEDEKIGEIVFPGKYGRGRFGKYRSQTTSVGYFNVANAFGLYDMHGNVWEWCLDHWHKDYNSAPTDGSAWINKSDNYSNHILKGGSWQSFPRVCRSAFRMGDIASIKYDGFGFRIVCAVARTKGLLVQKTFSASLESSI